MRDHWFATVLLTIVDAVKVVFSFLNADNTINVCLQSNNFPAESDEGSAECKRKVQLSQILGVVISGVQVLILVSSL